MARQVALPPAGHPTLQVYVDESGVANQSRYLAVGALVFRRDHGLLTNQVLALRDRTNWRSEAHFVAVNRTTAHLYRELVNRIASSDGRFVCAVVDKREWDPFKARRDTWKTYAQLTIQLLNAVVGKGNPVLSVVVDHLTTPEDVNYEGYVATAVNRTLRYLAVAGVNRMDSRACIGLQLADILTGAVAHQYRQTCDSSAKPTSPKGQVASHVAQAWNLSTLVGAGSPRFKVIDVRPRTYKKVVATRAGNPSTSKGTGDAQPVGVTCRCGCEPPAPNPLGREPPAPNPMAKF